MKQFHVRFSETQMRKLEERSKYMGSSKADIIRTAVDEYFTNLMDKWTKEGLTDVNK